MVNIMDVETGEDLTLLPRPACRLHAIFEKQMELLEKYHPIEIKSGLRLCHDVPVDLHDPKGQSTLKDYAWRFTEEMAEALEAFNLHKDNPLHCAEELADALHFLVEFTILAGVHPQELVAHQNISGSKDLLEDLYHQAYACLGEDIDRGITGLSGSYTTLLTKAGQTMEAMGKTCNTLKNKPWKQSHMLTDIPRFKGCLLETWTRFIALCIMDGLDEETLYRLYINKNAVNAFRQRSNY